MSGSNENMGFGGQENIQVAPIILYLTLLRLAIAPDLWNNVTFAILHPVVLMARSEPSK